MLRYEYKYIVPKSKEALLRKMILPFVRLDSFAATRENHEYTVRSIYFDTPDYRHYFEKVEGIKNRKKLRIRGYNNIEDGRGDIFFEIKRKYEIPIYKNRSRTTFDHVLRLFDQGGAISSLMEAQKSQKHRDDAQRFFYQLHLHKMRPVVLIVYEREAFQGVHDDTIRITFDKNLRSGSFPKIENLYEENRLKSVMRDYFILEVKFNDYFPSWMGPIIACLGLKRESASKYVMGIDALNMLNPNHLPHTFLQSNLFRKIY